MDSIQRNVPINTLTEVYLSNRSVLDECFNPDEQPRDSWKQLLANIETLGTSELKSRQQELLKLLQENGVTYNIYGDTNGLNRPWLLDTIPLVISAVDWRGLERGMNQSAFRPNKMRGGLYDERALLQKGTSHPELNYSHPQ